MAVGRVIALVLEVADLSASARFYREGLGLDLHEGADNGAPGDRWISGRHAAISWGDGAFLHFSLYQAKSDVTHAVQIGFLPTISPRLTRTWWSLARTLSMHPAPSRGGLPRAIVTRTATSFP